MLAGDMAEQEKGLRMKFGVDFSLSLVQFLVFFW